MFGRPRRAVSRRTEQQLVRRSAKRSSLLSSPTTDHRRRCVLWAGERRLDGVPVGFSRNNNSQEDDGRQLLLGMGGYSWCAALAKCVRPGRKRPCPDTLEIDAPTPTHNVTSVPTTVPIPRRHHHKDEDRPSGRSMAPIVMTHYSARSSPSGSLYISSEAT